MNKVIESYNKIAPTYETVLGYSYMFLKDEIDGYFRSLQSGASVLDAGCGPGFEAEIAVAAGLRVSGLDLSEAMVARFKARLPGAESILASITQIPVANQTFDAVFTSCALLHLDRESGERAVSELFRVLKSGGSGFIGTSMANNEIDLHKRPAFEQVGVDDLFFYHWSREDFAALLTRVGFKIFSIHAKPIIENRPTYTHFLVSKN